MYGERIAVTRNGHEDEATGTVNLLEQTNVRWKKQRKKEHDEIFEVRSAPEHAHHKFETKNVPVEFLENMHSIHELSTLSLTTADMVEEVAKEEENLGQLVGRRRWESCQSWCVRVVRDLVNRGVMKMEKVGMLEV
jgi:hypothetical protein